MTSERPVPRPTSAVASPSAAVVIPCWNAENFVAGAIQSALDQHYPSLEIIAIDDGSTDGSLDIIRSFAGVGWETGPNRGACIARNRGLALTAAEYVLFLDADDYITPGSLDHWVKRADGDDLVLGPFAYEYAGTRTSTHQPHRSVDRRTILQNWLSGGFTPPCAVLWRRDFLHRIGAWHERSVRNDDGELVVRALLADARVALADAGLGVYVQHNATGRVSKRTGRDLLVDTMEVYEDLVGRPSPQFPDLTRTTLSHLYYQVSYEAFAGRLDDIGYQALRKARDLGLRGHVGSLRHRMLAGILGLRMKLRVTGFLRGRA